MIRASDAGVAATRTALGWTRKVGIPPDARPRLLPAEETADAALRSGGMTDADRDCRRLADKEVQVQQ
ncbi:unnamed protein product [Mycetohabitans rhizoxinica HKI 454]|uniref:Uncharacterized protein n=1 Tax=Mycetohabitans rhizoxinica (strain DSM 19002 / CIP 109453 / HKI 454) TaxID=882378 RepID=E5ALH2_MYCRK|nr:hypothetical protein [Mycetohabitans rhizoxinica]CBW73845.1 unnamed protein product [Mycetohabitans rhizoxinica HKI 454]